MSNKKILISLGVIFVLIVYLVVSKHLKSPDSISFDVWEGSAGEIDVKKKDFALKLVNKAGKWVINDQAYPATANLVSDMETKIKEIRVDSIVSTQGFYDKYDLGPDKNVEVTVKKEGKVVRKLTLGKKGSTYRHTYARIDDKPEIYLLNGTYDSVFDKTVDDLRDKDVLKITKDGILSLEITYGGAAFAFSKVMEDQPADPKAAGKDKKKDEKKKVEKWICKGNPINIDQPKFESFLSLFNPLKAVSYPEDVKKESLFNPMCTVKLNAYGKEISLMIFNKKDDMYMMTASESPYVFTMNEHTVKRFLLTNLDEFKVQK